MRTQPVWNGSVRVYAIDIHIRILTRLYISYIIVTSPSVSVASRRITHSKKSLRDLCSFIFDDVRLNDIFEILYTQLACMITPGNSPDASQSDYFENWVLLYIHMTLLKVSYSESATVIHLESSL